LRSRLEWRVHSNFFTDFQQNILALKRLETLGFHPHCVSARRQIRRYVLSRLVGGQSSWNSTRHIGDRYRGSDDVSSGLVGNRAQDLAVAALPVQLKTARQQSQQGHEEANSYQGAYRPKSLHSCSIRAHWDITLLKRYSGYTIQSPSMSSKSLILSIKGIDFTNILPKALAWWSDHSSGLSLS
jgi:hypothetical protein